jgi:hypothetical protein
MDNSHDAILAFDPVELFGERRRKDKITTFLKAFHGAPVWTPKELAIFKKVFEEFGFQILKSSIPKANRLHVTWQ